MVWPSLLCFYVILNFFMKFAETIMQRHASVKLDVDVCYNCNIIQQLDIVQQLEKNL